MPSISVPAAGAALTANGTAVGLVTVADTTPFYAGALAWLSCNTPANMHVRITKILSATTMTVAMVLDSGSNVNNLSYAQGSDISAFTTAATARIDMPEQLVRVEFANAKRNTAF